MSSNTNNILKNALECLEDTLTLPRLRENSYQDLKNALNEAEAIDKETAKRLLAICIHDLNDDIKYATNASTIIGALLLKIKNEQYSTLPNLVTSAVSVISLMKTVASANHFDALKGILFNTLLSYPDSTLMCVVTENTDKVMELLNAYINAGNKVVPIKLTTTLLNILTPEIKITFVKEVLALWFSKLIPLAMGCIQTEQHVTTCVEMLELLADILVDIEYAENPHWKILIEYIYNPKKYPAIMKSMLENRSDYWHRLWIVFIKLLKDQITKVSNNYGSPINSMLPVVETAFKMDPVNRCRAFQCWRALIDNFSKESIETYVNKRLKLLIIPLKSNNAKVEETAISKFSTWWHLILQFHSKLDGLAEMILMPFIHFCFGKKVAKSPVAPGQLSDSLKKLSVQALVEIFGHVDCEGCVNIPKLKSRLINTKILVDYWDEWVYSYKVALTTALENNSEQILQQIGCIWKSLVMTIGELPENNIRRDLFTELLTLILVYVQSCQSNAKLADVVMNILIKSLFEDDNKIKSLLVTKEMGPMFMILPILGSSCLEEFYKRKTVDELLLYFRPITSFMMDVVLCCPNRITTWLLKRLPANDNTLVLWMALVEAVCESKHDLAEETLVAVLSYPIQDLNKYSYEKSTFAAYKWFAAYSTLGPKLENRNFDKECIQMIREKTELDGLPAKMFILYASLAVIKKTIVQNIDHDCANVTQIFLNSMSTIDTYNSIEKLFPALIDTLSLMGSKLKDNINMPLAKTYVLILKLTVKLLLQQTITDTTIIFVEKMLLTLLDILKVKEYQDLVLMINDEILACASIDKKHASKIKSSLAILTLHLSNNKNKNKSELKEQKKGDTVSDLAARNNENIKKMAENINNVKEGFNAPNISAASIKSNKRAASIVNTVVENGEEYVVVKSNWKFNPRKLTENQKEKLKRKREDIPALYQDLSQSQDEFKLCTWKPDSQDTSTTSSKSASKSNNEDATAILNQIPNTDVVPRIFENVIADSVKNNDGDTSSCDSAIINNNTSNVQKQTTSTKEVKSPRMALKDRVFRNVRNLVEKSSLPQDVSTLITEDINKTLNENAAKTPKNKAKISTNVVNSAPTKMVSERPSRVIKIPKKFDDSEILSLKKRWQSQDLPVDKTKKTCLNIMRESQDSQFDTLEISLKNGQQSLNSQSDNAKNMNLKTNEQSEVDASKVSDLRKKRQLQDSQFVDPEIISLKDSQQESLSDNGKITDSIKQQLQVSQADTPKNSRLKKRLQSQDSQSSIIKLNSAQSQESHPDNYNTKSFRNRRKSLESRADSPKFNNLKKKQHSQLFDPDIMSLGDNQQVHELRSNGDEITDLITKNQLQAPRPETPEISNLKKRRQSQDSKSVISETNSKQLQKSRADTSKVDSLRNRRKSQDSRSDDTKLKSSKIRRQSQDSQLVDPEIVSLKDSQQVQESRSDDGGITDLITKNQLQVPRPETPETSNLKRRRQSHDSNSVISETNSKQLQESRAVASKVDSLRNRRKSQDSRSDDTKVKSSKKRRQSQDSQLVDPEIISFKDSQQVQESRSDDGEITDLITKNQLQVPRPETPETSNLKRRRQSQDSKSVISETNSKQLRESRAVASKVDSLRNRRKSQDSRSDDTKVKSSKKRRQSQDSQLVDPEIISFKDSQQVQESRSDDGEITDLITKNQLQVPRPETPETSNLKRRRQSQDSKSVISETNSKQLRESRVVASKVDSLRNRRKSQDSRSDDTKVKSSKKRRQSQDSQLVDPEIITLKDSQQVQESLSDEGKITELVTKNQLQAPRPETPEISNLKKRHQSEHSKSIISETNNKQLQESEPGGSKMGSLKNRRQSQDSWLINSSDVPSHIELKEGDAVEHMEDLDEENNFFGFTNDYIQDTQNLDILVDSQPKEHSTRTGHNEQASNGVLLQDMPLESQPEEQFTKCVSHQDTSHDSLPTVQSMNNIPFKDVLPGLQIKEYDGVFIEKNKVKQITGDNNGKKGTSALKTNKRDEEKYAKKKGSRIVKNLLIDMVVGNPLYQAPPVSKGSTLKRSTRKSLLQTPNNNNRGQTLSEKLEKFKSDLQIVPLPTSATKTTKKLKDKASLSPKETLINASQEKQLDERSSYSSDDQPLSEDVIESSQDSTATTISVKSSKSILKKQVFIKLSKMEALKTSVLDKTPEHDEINDEIISLSDTLSADQENKEDSQFPKNMTVEKPELDLTENMDTQPVKDREICEDVIFVTNEQEPIVINSENTFRELNTQETAKADTKPMGENTFRELNTQETAKADTEPMDVTVEITENIKTKTVNSETNLLSSVNTQDDTNITNSETLESLDRVEQNYSPSNDEPERQQDFLNNTQEISPIKSLSPLQEKLSLSPETSDDYVVIKLTSPVHSNGEPYEKCDSPEIFTEDKMSPDKRNESPPRVEVVISNSSPSSSLSLKKNRPQMRAGGRAAQMLDLCAVMNNDDSADSTDKRRNTPVSTPAKRNLKSIYNPSVANATENIDLEPGSETAQFLEFKKSLPTANSSPAGPILKRKFTEITDETTSSPANKRKRVSFHDPPVSTTVAVQKYICAKPGAIRSPQHSTIKRRDRIIRSHTAMKSPKKLENVFKLENVLSKAVKSFTEDAAVASMEDTELSSIEQTPTPALEVVKSSDLNDTDSICPALVSCNDPIENIATELSSPAMKSLFIKEIEGKVGTIAELAKMTELEINRLCIKAPKVHVARKVLLEYAFKKVVHQDPELDNQNNLSLTTQEQAKIVLVDAEIQTSDSEMQMDTIPVAFMQTQTDCIPVAHSSAQTVESGFQSTKDVIASCMSERPDFIPQLSKQLDVHTIADNTLSFNDVLELLLKKMTVTNSVEVMNKVLEVQSKSNISCNSTQNELSFVHNYLINRYDSKDLFHSYINHLLKIFDERT